MSKAMMLALPEVAYLVERIPIARVVIKADPIHLRFCQHAKESGMGLKEQCRILDIPWHARKITAATASKKALDVSRFIEPSVFSQTFPSDSAVHATHWCDILLDMKDGSKDRLHWLAFNVISIKDKWADVKRYITSAECKGMPMSLLPATVLTRTKEWVEETERARQARYREIDITRDPARYVELLRSGLIGNDQWVRQAYLQNTAQAAAMQREMEAQYMFAARNAQAAYPRHIAWDLGEEDRGNVTYDAHLLEPFTVGDLTVKLLNTYEQFRAEGKNMHHCVEQYFSRAKQGGCRIVNVSTQAKSVATAEFTRDWELIQVKGPANARIESGPVIDALRSYGRAKSAPAPVAQIAPPPEPAPPPKPISVDTASWTGRKTLPLKENGHE